MTSTNDEKDVKSNQTSGQKGKKYYIDLYNSLDARLSSECELRERTGHLCEAWGRIHCICRHALPASHPLLLGWLERHTATIVLQTEWQSPNSKDEQTTLREALESVIRDVTAAVVDRHGSWQPWETHLRQRADWFKNALANPWVHPVLSVLLDPQGKPPSDDDVLEWLTGERDVVFLTRLRQLVASKCDDLATSLATAVMDRARAARAVVPDVEQADEPKDKPTAEGQERTFEGVMRAEAGFTDESWALLADMEFVLLHKAGRRSRCIELAKLTPLRAGYELVQRLQKRLENAKTPRDKRLWKSANDVATLIAQVVIARCMVVPSCGGAARSALYCCARALVALLGVPALRRATAALAAPAATAAHLYWLARAVNTHTQKADDMKPFVCELYVRAITSGMNELEKLKLDPEKEPEARSTEQTLASWFIELGSLFAASPRFKCECTLTAFSVHPSPAMYERIKMAPILPPVVMDVQEPKEETNLEYGSWATDSRAQTNFVKTSETLNIKLTQDHANVLSTAILAEGESLGLGVDVCQDIAVLLSGPREKTLSWDMDRERLLENCRTYIERTHGGTRAVTTELKFLNLNLDDYQHLPEEEDDDTDIYYGIEKGYEHLVEFQEAQPEAIWDDPLWYDDTTESACTTPYDSDHNSTSRQKKSKGHSRSSGDDSDPLSLVAESKREKKKDRSHGKERRKSKKGGSRSKKKEKKERKLKKSDDHLSECKSNSLSSLIGIKVARVPMIAPDVKNERRDVNYTGVTDSDNDCQGKSSIQSEPDILYDGQFSMDELKSSEREMPDEVGKTNICNGLTTLNCNVDTNKLTGPMKQANKPKKSRKNVNKTLPSETGPTDNNHSLTRDLATNSAILPQKPIDKTKQNCKNVIKKIPEPSVTSADDANKELKRKIAKLMQFRRQKALTNITPKQEPVLTQESVPKKELVPKQEFNPKQGSKFQPKQEPVMMKTDMSVLIGSKIAKPTDVPKVMMKQHADQLGVLANEMNNLLPNPGITFKPPMVKHHYEKLKDSCSRVLPIKYHYSKKSSPLLNKPTNVFQNTSHSKPATEISDNREKFSQVPPCHIAPERPAFDKHQNSFQEFLKELQGTINAGVNTHSKQSSGIANVKKEMKPLTDVSPVIHNIIKAEPTISPQCAKPVVQPKKVENVPNTFSRLSYMHKNKQSETKPKPTADPMITPEIQNRLLLQNSIHAELDQRIADMKLNNLKYLHNISISRVDKSAATAVPNESSRVAVQKIGMPPHSSLVGENPVLTNILQENTANLLIKRPNARTESHKKNDNLEQSRNMIMSMPSKTQTTSLSETDQQDLLVLLRQQYKLNSRAIITPAKTEPDTSKLINNLRVSNISVTSNSGLSTYAPVLVSNANLKNTQLNVPPNTPMSHDCVDIKNPAADSRKINNQTDLIHSKLNLNHPIPYENNNIKIPTNLIQNQDKIKQQPAPKAFKPTVNCPKDRSSELNMIQKTVTNINEISRDTANKKSNELKQDWATVLDAIRAHKTPSRGPSALDLVKKDSYEKYTNSLRNQRIVRTNTAGESSKVTKTISSSIQYNIGITPQPPSNIPPAPNSKQLVKEAQDIAKIQSQNELIKEPNQIDFHNKGTTEIPKKFTCELQKDDDPFISGIPNSDYDLIEELMDDDLRKEIGELSDDELYGLPAVSKVPKNNSNAKSNSETHKKPIANFPVAHKSPIVVDPRSVLFKQKNSALNKPTEQPILKYSTTLKIADTKIIKTSSTIPTNVSNLKPQIVTHEKVDKQPKNTLLTPIHNVVKHLPKNIVVSHSKNGSKPAFNVNNNVVSNNQVQPKLDSTKVLITGIPQPAVQNMVVFDAYSNIQQLKRSQIQSALNNVNSNSYVTINSTPNLTVFKRSQQTSDTSPVIVATTITLPVTTSTDPTSTFAPPFNTVQNVQSIQAKAIKTSTTVATVVSNQTFLTKTPNTVPNEPEAVVRCDTGKVSDERKLKLDLLQVANIDPITESKEFPEFNTHKIDRKVLSVVQAKQDAIVPKKNDSKNPRNRRSLEIAVKKDTLKEKERLIMKRLALINREIYHRCVYPPIPLAYAPLRVPTVTVDCKGEYFTISNNEMKNLSNVVGKLSVMDSNSNKVIENTENKSITTVTPTDSNPSADIRNPDIPESLVVENTVQELNPASAKENKQSASQCRRRTSNSLKGKAVKSKAKSKGRKTKVRLKVAVAGSKEDKFKNCMVVDKNLNSSKVNESLEQRDNDAHMIVDTRNNNKPVESATNAVTLAPSRISRRILERKIKLSNEPKSPITEVTADKNTVKQFTVNVDNDVFEIEDSLLGAKIEKTSALKKNNDTNNFNLLPESETIQVENLSTNISENKCKDPLDAKIASLEIYQPAIEFKDKPEMQELVQDVTLNIGIKSRTSSIAELTKESKSAVAELTNEVQSAQNETNVINKIETLTGFEVTKKLRNVQESLPTSTANDPQKVYQPIKSAVVKAIDAESSVSQSLKNETKFSAFKHANADTIALGHMPKLKSNQDSDDNVASTDKYTIIDENKPHSGCVYSDSQLMCGSVIKNAADISKSKKIPKQRSENNIESNPKSTSELRINHSSTDQEQCLDNNFESNSKSTSELTIIHSSTEQEIRSTVINSDLIKDKDNRADEVISIESDSESINSEMTNDASEKSKKKSNTNKQNKKDVNFENSEIPQSYKDTIQFEELPLPDVTNSLKRCVRIRLPNGKTFKATVCGAVPVNVDILFADPALRNVLLKGINDKKHYTLSIQHFTTPTKTDTRIRQINMKNKTLQSDADTVNLISDDEDDVIQNFTTEFGKYIVSSLDKDKFTLHQNKFSQKCAVKLNRCPLPEQDPIVIINESDALVETTDVTLQDPDTPFKAFVNDKENVLRNLVENILTDTVENICDMSNREDSSKRVNVENVLNIPQIIEIDDSSNESVILPDILSTPQPVMKIHELKNLLLKDLGVDDIFNDNSMEMEPDKPDNKLQSSKTIQKNVKTKTYVSNSSLVDDEKCECVNQDYSKIIQQKCFVKLVRCDNHQKISSIGEIQTDSVSDSEQIIEDSDIEENILDRDTSQPRLWRSDSFSILNEFVVDDDIFVPILDSDSSNRNSPVIKVFESIATLRNIHEYERSSPVMEAFEAIVSIRNNCGDNNNVEIEETGLSVNVTEHIKCHTDWLATKCNLHHDNLKANLNQSEYLQEVSENKVIVPILNDNNYQEKPDLPVAVTEVITCYSDWCLTKRNLHYHCQITVKPDDIVVQGPINDILSDYENEHVTLPKPHFAEKMPVSVWSLSKIMWKYFENNSIGNEIKSLQDVRRKFDDKSSMTLKRKTSDTMNNSIENRLHSTSSDVYFKKARVSCIPYPKNDNSDESRELVDSMVSSENAQTDKVTYEDTIADLLEHEIITYPKSERDITKIETKEVNSQSRQLDDIQLHDKFDINFKNLEYQKNINSGDIDSTSTSANHYQNDVLDIENEDIIEVSTEHEDDEKKSLSSEIYIEDGKVNVERNVKHMNDLVMNEEDTNNCVNDIEINNVMILPNQIQCDEPIISKMINEIFSGKQVENVNNDIVESDNKFLDNESNLETENIAIEDHGIVIGHELDTVTSVQENKIEESTEIENIQSGDENKIKHLELKANFAMTSEKLASEDTNESNETEENVNKLIIELPEKQTGITDNTDMSKTSGKYMTSNNSTVVSDAIGKTGSENYVNLKNISIDCELSIDNNTGKTSEVKDKNQIEENATADEKLTMDDKNESMEIEDILPKCANRTREIMKCDHNLEIPSNSFINDTMASEVELRNETKEGAEQDTIKSIKLEENKSLENYNVVAKNIIETSLKLQENNQIENRAECAMVYNVLSVDDQNVHIVAEKTVKESLENQNDAVNNNSTDSHNLKVFALENNSGDGIAQNINNTDQNDTIGRDNSLVIPEVNNEIEIITIDTDDENKYFCDTKIFVEALDDIYTKNILKEDPEANLCYVFPLTKLPESSTKSDILNIRSKSMVEVIQEIEDEHLEDLNESTDSYDMDLKLVIPKVTYSRRNLKRKANMTDVNLIDKKLRRTARGKVSEIKRYKKARNIDNPRLSVTAMNDSSYCKEYKCLVNYYSSIKFSYSIPFDKEYIDVPDLLRNWPIAAPVIKESQDEVEFDDTLFVDSDKVTKPVTDPMQQTLAEEIKDGLHDYPSSEFEETNFSVGFGERSDGVIKNLMDGGALKFSAATLSDVKQSQPFLLSEVYDDCENEQNINHSNEDQKETIKRYINYIRVRDKVRTFFKKTAVELNRNLVNENKKDKTTLYSENINAQNFPFDLYIPKSIAPFPIEAIVQVVQVGQLPVSAAAQNPVTCDPRVTQVSDVSPSQCSAENSPQDDSQQEIKTEYTELTTADLTLPLVHDYSQHHQAVTMESQPNMNMSAANENIPIETELIKSEVKIELVEETPEDKDEHKSQDNNELQTSELRNEHINNVDYSYDIKDSVDPNVQILFTTPDKQKVAETFSEPKPNVPPEKTDQIAHAMNAAGITTTAEPEMDNTTALVNMLSQKILQGAVNASQNSTNAYAKATSINTMSLQQALAHILPPPLNQTNTTDNSQQGQNTAITPQVLHIVQGKNASGNQITLVDNTQQSIINAQNATPVLHIVQNKVPPAGSVSNGTPQQNTFSGLSLVDAGLQQGGNQLLHIVNTGNQKNNNAAGQLLKRVNLLTNLANVQGANEQKMVQFVCKSADGKAIQLNAPHQRSMVLRLQPIETPKPVESLDSSPSSAVNSSSNTETATAQQEIKSRSVYEENYAKFIQNSAGKPPISEKSTSLPKFNQAFGKPIFQDGSQKQNEINGSLTPGNTNGDSGECQSTDNTINMEHIRQIGSPPLLLRKPPQPSQPQANLVQQIKQTIAPMNIQTMHGGVIYTRQIPVNIGGGQTINLITVPSTELIDDSGQKQQSDVKIFNQGEIEPSIIKIVPQAQPVNAESSQDESNNHINVTTDNAQNPQSQPLLTQMRIKLPMLTKSPQMVSGARVVRPSFFQIQRNVIGGANQPVYQQLVLTAAPPLGQQTIRLPQAQTRQVKVPADGQSSSESQMSTSTLEQLREFDMVLEQVKERSTVQPNTNPNATFKLHAPSTETSNGSVNSTPTETTQQVLYSIGTSQPLNVAYVNRKTILTTPTTSTFVRSSDTLTAGNSATSSNHVQLPRTRSSESSSNGTPSHSRAAKVGSKPKTRNRASSNPPMKTNPVPPKPTVQKPQEDEQTTQRILYILAEYKEQVENSPDKDKPAPRRRSNPPLNPSGSSKRRKSSRRSGGRDLSPTGDDSCRTMGSEDSSCGTSQGDCSENCLEPNSPQDSPRKVVRKLTFEQDPVINQPRPQPPRNVIVADGQTITVARGTAGKPATAVLMPANYILPVSMVKGGQQIAIVTNRGPKLLTVGGGEGGATNALLLQRLIGPAGLKPVLARPGVRHVRLPTTAIHNLQAFNLTTAATVQPPNTSSPAPAPTPTPPDLVETGAERSPWADREPDNAKPDRGSSPEASEPWNLPSSADPHEYHYEETVQTDNMNRTVLDPIPDRYSPDMEAQRIFDKMFDVDSKKSYDSQDDQPRCGYDIDASDDDKAYHQVVQKKEGAAHRQHRLTHVSAAALRHKYAILEHELRLQKSLSEECEDLGVDSPSASELFPEAELLFAASPAPEHQHHSHTPQPLLNQSVIHADIDDQIATDQLLAREGIPDDRQELEVNLGLEDVGIVTVSEDGMQTTVTLDHEEFARAHPNTTFHSEPTDEGEVQPFTITGLKSRHITSTIFHSNRAPATVLMTAPQTTVISQAISENPQSTVKYNLNMINSMPVTHGNNINLSSVLVKDDGLTRFDSILTDSRELHLSNTASAVIHSSGNATQVIRRVCYEDDKRERDARFLMDEPDGVIAGDDAKMVAEDSSRDATLDSMAGDVHDGNSSPERHVELFWESNSASERSDGRRPLDFSSDSEKCCKSPSFDETNSTDSSGVGTHMRLDSVIKEARGIERSASADGSSADDTHPPLRTYPPKRLYHPLEREMERSLSGKTRAGERSPDSLEVRRRASGRGVVKRGCHCCNGSPAPQRPKKPRQRKPANDFTNI